MKDNYWFVNSDGLLARVPMITLKKELNFIYLKSGIGTKRSSRVIRFSKLRWQQKIDQFRFLENCPPAPPHPQAKLLPEWGVRVNAKFGEG